MLPENDKVTVEVAKIIREDFLQQNIFSPYDKYCPFYKGIWMMKNIVTFHDLAQKAVKSSNKITWEIIKNSSKETILYKLMCMKFMVILFVLKYFSLVYYYLSDRKTNKYTKLK